jgi:tRNA(Ile)-lysidine synthase
MLTRDNVPLLFPRAALHAEVVARADQSVAEEPDAPWCVAFSGGADSLALLLSLFVNWPAKRGRLTALHFNHCLRGAESEKDEVFCRTYCEALGVGFRSGRWDGAFPGAGEAPARAARMAFFAEEMTVLGARILWTGHQKDDIAETMLMRIARGSSMAGLAAPRPVQVAANGRIFLRPLLSILKAEIVRALAAAGVEWREDASNGTGDFFRNRVRHDVVPAWRAAAENDAFAGAALTRELLADDDAALDAWLADLMPSGVYSLDTLDLRALAGRPRALLRRALRRWPPLAEQARGGFEDVLAICEHGAGRASVGEGVVEMREGILHFRLSDFAEATVPFWEAVGLQPGARLFLPTGACVAAEPVSFTPELREFIYTGRVDPAREAFVAGLIGKLIVRLGRAGDRFRPLGAPGSAKLQDLFVNRKIPVALRRTLPVVCDEAGAILWIPGFSPAEDSKVTDANVTGVHLTYESGTYTVRP